MNPKSSSNRWPAHAARIALFVLGTILMGWGTLTPLLGLIGDTAPATIILIRRQGGERNEALRGRYTFAVNYRFTTHGGQTIEGFSYLVGRSYGLAPGQLPPQPKVRYFSFFPRFNTLAQQARPNLEHLILLGVGYMLAFGLWRKKGRKQSPQS